MSYTDKQVLETDQVPTAIFYHILNIAGRVELTVTMLKRQRQSQNNNKRIKSKLWEVMDTVMVCNLVVSQVYMSI